MFQISVNTVPLPKTQEELLLNFQWRYFEDDSGMTPAAFEHRWGYIPLESNPVEDDSCCFYEGEVSVHSKFADNIPISGHDHGIYFSAVLANIHNLINGNAYWRSYVSSDDLKELLDCQDDNAGSNPLVRFLIIRGTCSYVPNSKAHAAAKLHLVKKKQRWYIEKVSFVFPVDYHNMWFEVVCGETQRYQDSLIETAVINKRNQ